MATIRKTNHTPFSRVRDQFRDASATFDTSLPPAVSQAMRSLLAALEYEDRPLIRSHLENAFAALTEAVGEVIGKRLDWSRSTRTRYHQLAAEVGGTPSEEFDEVGRFVTAELEKIIHALTELRDGLIRKMNLVDVAVPGKEALEIEIQEMESFKTSLVGGWPWSHLPLPSSDPAMLARARAETKSGQGVSVEELIQKIKAAD